MVEMLIVHPIIVEYLLPLVLIFTLIFAILEKTNLLGEDKRQINAIIGGVIGLLLVATPYARNIVIGLMPFLAVIAVILLVLMLLMAFVRNTTDGDPLNKYLKGFVGTAIVIALVFMLLLLSGFGAPLYQYFFDNAFGKQVFLSILMILVLAGAVIAVIRGGGS